MIRVGITGYGNLGKGVECSIAENPDMELVGVFTRRAPEDITIATPGVKVYNIENIPQMAECIDIMIICGGSAFDLPKMTPDLARHFNVIDSFDNHANIPQHFAAVDQAAKEASNLALISGGWDPGLFSVNRLYASCVLPNGTDYTFWGRGVSQGHGDAIRQISGVVDARQYTVPVPETLARVQGGETPELTAREKHTRECFVVAEEGADLEAIEQAIKTMPAYFAPYDTTVTFITPEEMQRDHAGMPHGGQVIRSGKAGWNGENCQTIEYKLTLDSNPHFTGSILVAYARAMHRMAQRGETGCRTVFDIAPADLSILSGEELRAKML